MQDENRKRINVVFDCNAYHQFSDARFEELRELEARKRVIAFASLWTTAELLAHVLSVKDPSYRPAVAAIRRLVRHCSQPGRERPQFRLLTDSENQMCQSLFGSSIPNREEQGRIYTELLYRVASSTSPSDLDAIRPTLRELAQKIEKTEEQFVADMMDYVVKALDPKATSWRPLINDLARRKLIVDKFLSVEGIRLAAMVLVTKAAGQLGVRLEDSVLDEKIAFLVESFETPLRLYNNIVKRIIDGCDVSRPGRPNWIWDIQLAFSTSPHGRIDGAPIWFVTNDGAILDAARESGAAHLIRPVNEYRTLLEVADDEFDRIVAAAELGSAVPQTRDRG